MVEKEEGNIQEDSGSEDDDEYPDRVVVAPVAASPSFEEVEQERLKQEQFGKEAITYRRDQPMEFRCYSRYRLLGSRPTTSSTCSGPRQPWNRRR